MQNVTLLRQEESKIDMSISSELVKLCSGLPLGPLPELRPLSPEVPHAPKRMHRLNEAGIELAIRNALRYIPKVHHELLEPEFRNELSTYGHIYMYRFRPTVRMRAYKIDEYPAKCKAAAAIMQCIMNNLNPEVAQYPEELVIYGGNGQAFSNWAQFLLTMRYLSICDEHHTISLSSGHPTGMYRSLPTSPRMVITNGLMIPGQCTATTYEDLFALGVTQYGQMTAGSFCYIGPQGIVHGTLLTLKGAARKYLKVNDLKGKCYLSSGLGGMSGAQAKAAVMAGCVTILAEVELSALIKRKSQGWLDEYFDCPQMALQAAWRYKREGIARSVGFHGNVVQLWLLIVDEFRRTGECLPDLASDQTSCHNLAGGGYIPYGLTLTEAHQLLVKDNSKFLEYCNKSLVTQVSAINFLTERAGLKFWDYGNSFLACAHEAGAELSAEKIGGVFSYRYPSYVQDVMGELFAKGFGPFRWICCSASREDLKVTDKIAKEQLKQLIVEMDQLASGSNRSADHLRRSQYEDNIEWLDAAQENDLVVGCPSRILYADLEARQRIALAFNEAIRINLVNCGIILSRDHHDTGSVDSPRRETSNIYDGSSGTADMATHALIGAAVRSASWCALHNGGGVGWNQAVNCGFGLYLSGDATLNQVISALVGYDVSNGITRRAWSGDPVAIDTMQRIPLSYRSSINATLPHHTDAL